jgi:anti-sigma factor (TIGR02949 family)
MGCGCGDCEEMMQPYLDGILSDEQVQEAKEHLERCPPCEKRYTFEVTLRRYVRVAASEPIPEELQAKLVELRSSAE